MKPLAREALQRIAGHCLKKWDRHYSMCKMCTDPAYPAIAALLEGATRPLLDIGCGIGLLAFYLRESGFHAPITGMDYDPRKIKSACQIAQTGGYADLSFLQGDARATLPPFEGNIMILDMLQWFTREEQSVLLQQAAARVAPGGRLMIRSGLRDGSWRYKITVFGDYLARWTLWIKAAPVCYPEGPQLEAELQQAGLRVQTSPLWGGTPFNNFLIVGERPAAG